MSTAEIVERVIEGDEDTSITMVEGLLPVEGRFLASRHFGAIDLIGIGLRQAYARSLVARIHRQPVDLRAHVERVFLHGVDRKADRCYAALVDLFLVLKEKGVDLRIELLTRFGDLLTEAQLLPLRTYLGTGLSHVDPIPPADASIFSRGVLGRTDMVMREGGGGDGAALDPLQEANGLLEQGDVDGAKGVLVTTLLNQPGHEEAELLLLEILAHTQDHAEVRRVMVALSETVLLHGDRWAQLTADAAAG